MKRLVYSVSNGKLKSKTDSNLSSKEKRGFNAAAKFKSLYPRAYEVLGR